VSDADLYELRPYDPSTDDEAGCVFMWVHSHRTHGVRARRLRSLIDPQAAWDELAPVARRMLRERRCDVLSAKADPSTILGWVCYELEPYPLLHGAAVKASMAGDDTIGRDWTPVVELTRELLAPLLSQRVPVGITMEIPYLSWQEVRAAGWQRPNSWYQDDTYYARRWMHG
jgi:hypothetical protein